MFSQSWGRSASMNAAVESITHPIGGQRFSCLYPFQLPFASGIHLMQMNINSNTQQ
uniref:Uncharacterized protein n=1 Tax=Anguilla anguilla TaxID=7936 RepID=A0A0E9X0N5_ANGAN